MTQPEFHRRYLQTEPGFRAELLAGVVHVSCPQKHRTVQSKTSVAVTLKDYELATPGGDAGEHPTVVLCRESEVEPDGLQRVLPEFGGRCRVNRGGYLVCPPELIVEEADATLSRDHNARRAAYRATGVRESVALAVRRKRLPAVNLPVDRELPLDSDGVFRSRSFPGLWVDAAAVLKGKLAEQLRVPAEGLASPEHAGFVRSLAAVRSRTKATGPSYASSESKPKSAPARQNNAPTARPRKSSDTTTPLP